MQFRSLLAQPHLSVITRQTDGELTRIQDMVEHKVLVDGRADLETMFGRLLATDAPPMPKTLDLIGHSNPGKSLLMLGDWVIDAGNPTVTAFFRELADHDVFARLGITALRLLGCRTADTGAGRATIVALADLLGLEVFGTRALIYSLHYDAGGFADERSYVLVGSSELRDQESGRDERPTASPWPQVLDIDSLPETTTRISSGPWAHRTASEPQMREVLRLVKRRDGAQMPGLLSAPLCEIVFPGHAVGTFRRAQVVLDGEFVRFYPRGDSSPGVIWAVDDPHALVQLVEQLPAHSVAAQRMPR